jgi:phosphonatase-like hydrolase
MQLTRRQSLTALACAGVAVPRDCPAATPKLRLVVFDVGGTIIQDRGDVPEALHNAFLKRGITITPEEIAARRGASKKEVVRRFTNEHSKARGAELEQLVEVVYADFTANAIEAYKDVPPIPGAEDTFRSLLKSGILLAASTGFGREIAESIFRRLDWEKYFTATITSDEVTQGRPAPYMIFKAMEITGVTSVAEVLVIGDTPVDLQAGTNAGVRGVVGVLSGASKREKLEPEPHTDIIASVADLPALIASKY